MPSSSPRARCAAALVVAASAQLGACGDSLAPATDAAGDASLITDAAVDAPVDAPAAAWPFPLPPGFPPPRLPTGATLTAELAELGRYLFFDRRLSANGTQACGTCHLQAHAFADAEVTPRGSTGAVLRRSSMNLTNTAYASTYTWANPAATTLELQALVPIFGDHPIELGVAGHEQEILARLAADPAYAPRFAAAFPGQVAPMTWPNLIRAIAAFERRLVAGDSRVDRYARGDLGALTAAEERGQLLFHSPALGCFRCHGGFAYTIAVDDAERPAPTVAFFNNGLYNLDATGAYPAIDQGLWEHTGADGDRGKFRPPTLRNVAVTAPYMHDGSVTTLDDVVAIYERGGRLVASGPDAGDGRDNPNKSPLVTGFTLTAGERADLLAFLRALTDDGFLTDPTLADPFPPP